MIEMANAKKLPSARERLDLILHALAERESATALCRQAGVSRELFYRWMRSVREAGLKALESKAPGPKRVRTEEAEQTAQKLLGRVARLEKEVRGLRKDRDHWRLLAETAKRIIRRQAWGPVPEPRSKKKSMRSLKREDFTLGSGARNAPQEPARPLSPGAGESAEARTGGGPAGNAAGSGEQS